MTAREFLLACRLSMVYLARNLYTGCTCANCLRFAYMFIAHVHSAHILHTKPWRNLYANCLYATCLCFVYAFIARVHSAHILHTKHGIL